MAELIRGGGRVGAWQRSRAWAMQHACDEVRGWVGLAESGVDVPFYPLAGFVKIAFCHAMQHLRSDRDYREALRLELLGGGDTDTNACIVGGLVGAAHGAAAMPESMREAVLHPELELDPFGGRPSFLSPARIPGLVDALLGARG